VTATGSDTCILTILVSAGGLVSLTVNVAQFILAWRAKSLHVSDLDQIYSEAYHAAANAGSARDATQKNDMLESVRSIVAVQGGLNAIRNACQARTEHLVGRMPRLFEAGQCIKVQPPKVSWLRRFWPQRRASE